ncbi:TPA: class C sortase [Streptococcus suis]|nr:class C sortase [Streptococcus suis]HEM5148161.1 class C sortase [Streptococcus suis]HEM5149489.1 class C sortase [Streptococcus suis]HEM5204249.1 class C sortase [Streptococcus suis]HEM5208834.1 class C sortase [Streptococcus suis]
MMKNLLGSNRFLQKKLVLRLIFVLGLLITLYPLCSHLYYRYEADQEVQEFYQLAKDLPTQEVLNRLELARAYNKTLNPRKLQDPYSEEEKAGLAEYARMLEVKEKIGYVEIPKLNEKIPVYAGTSEEVLQKGVGHLEGSSLPVGGANSHTVLTAHRGLPTASLFTNLDQLKLGDRFYIHNIAEILAYEVDQILVVEPSDFEPVLVVEEKDYATLLTCTPYMVNSHRLLVRGHRIPYVPGVHEEEEPGFFVDRMLLSYLVAALLLILLLAGYLLFRRRKATRRRRS